MGLVEFQKGDLIIWLKNIWGSVRLITPIFVNASGLKPDTYFGEYCVDKMKNYYGGLSSEEEASRFLGKKVIINKAEYRGLTVVAENPLYAIEEIDDWSKVNTTFHGLYLDRSTHSQLVIYPDSKKEVKFWVEIINSELLITVYDGYLYELKKDCVKAL